jgi:hypothetical protein
MVSHRGFSESIKRFAHKEEIELIAEYEMTFEFPTLGEFIRRRRRLLEKERVHVDVVEPIEDFVDSVQPYQIETVTAECIIKG